MLAISLQNLLKQFPSPKGPTTAVNNVSLSIPAGSLFFILGPSGCGKTTLLRMLAGFVLPTSGKILFDDKDISQVPPHRRDTGMVFQSYALWPHMTIAQNIAFGLDARRIPKPQRDQRIDEALSLVRMAGMHDRKPNQLSGGQQQRVALARALAIRPGCLLLDEPLSNLDAKLRLEMRSEIRRIVKESGLTAIYVTHDQKEALSMADAIAVMNNGKVEQTGTPQDLYRRPATRFVAGFLGESNFLPGTVLSADRSTLRVQTPAGLITASAPIGKLLPTGTPVTLSFRPEAVTLPAPSASPAYTNRLTGKRLSSTYLGDMAEHLVSIPGIDSPIKAFQLNPSPETPAADLTLEIPADQMIIVQE